MGGLSLDMRDFERAARDFGAILDQVPFALAGAMNDALDDAYAELTTRTWPESITARNPSFIRAALTTRGNRATKGNLRVAIEDKLGRASLSLHAEGGEKLPKGKALAVPSARIAGARGRSGVPKGLRPRAIPNSFVKGNAIYQRIGKYEKAGPGKGKGYDGRGLVLMYTLAPEAAIRPDVPFEPDFERAFRSGIERAFGPRLQAAMAKRR